MHTSNNILEKDPRTLFPIEKTYLIQKALVATILFICSIIFITNFIFLCITTIGLLATLISDHIKNKESERQIENFKIILIEEIESHNIFALKSHIYSAYFMKTISYKDLLDQRVIKHFIECANIDILKFILKNDPLPSPEIKEYISLNHLNWRVQIIDNIIIENYLSNFSSEEKKQILTIIEDHNCFTSLLNFIKNEENQRDTDISSHEIIKLIDWLDDSIKRAKLLKKCQVILRFSPNSVLPTSTPHTDQTKNLSSLL